MMLREKEVPPLNVRAGWEKPLGSFSPGEGEKRGKTVFFPFFPPILGEKPNINGLKPIQLYITLCLIYFDTITYLKLFFCIYVVSTPLENS